MIRDFELPRSLVLQLANSPTPVFFTSYSLDALPQLNGALSYVTTSQDLPDVRSTRYWVQEDTCWRSGPKPKPKMGH